MLLFHLHASKHTRALFIYTPPSFAFGKRHEGHSCPQPDFRFMVSLGSTPIGRVPLKIAYARALLMDLTWVNGHNGCWRQTTEVLDACSSVCVGAKALCVWFGDASPRLHAHCLALPIVYCTVM